MVLDSWTRVPSDDTITKLQCCTEDLQLWAKRKKVNFKKDIEQCMCIIDSFRDSTDPNSVALFNMQKEKLVSLLIQEENY